jgi:predicted phosphodiesterase
LTLNGTQKKNLSVLIHCGKFLKEKKRSSLRLIKNVQISAIKQLKDRAADEQR